MTRHEAIEILEEVKMLDDSMFAYSQAYNDALEMAIEALQAQEPRVMTLEEVKASKGGDLYLELSDSPNDVPYITASTLDGVGKYGVSFYHTVCDFSTYGRRAYGWRCWTSRPSAAEREATPWN